MKPTDEPKKKVGIFDRLEQSKIGATQRIEVTGLDKSLPSTSASIFSRLGGKSDDIDLDDERAVAFAGILKSAPKKVIQLNIDVIFRLIKYYIFRIYSAFFLSKTDCKHQKTGQTTAKSNSSEANPSQSSHNGCRL